MKAATLAVAAVGLCGIATAHSAGPAEDASVIGGEAVPEGKWPDAVALVFDGQPFCSGTLIAPDLVLTAAHCVSDGFAPDIRVDSVDGHQGPIVATAEVHLYPNWESTYDAALLVLDSDVSGVAPRSLVPDCAMSELEPGARVTVAGFGDRGLDRGAPSGELYEADLTVTDVDCPLNEGCNPAVSPGGEMIATGQVGVDSCYGDSGGPLYLRSPYGDFLAGVVSRATLTAQADCGEGGIYVRADKLASWIEDTSGRSLRAGNCDEIASTGGGCNAAGAGSHGGSTGGLLLLIGLAFGLRRRRA